MSINIFKNFTWIITEEIVRREIQEEKGDAEKIDVHEKGGGVGEKQRVQIT